MNYIATVVGVSGNARAVRPDGTAVDLMPGSQLTVSDTVSTGAGASVCILFQDDAEISLGADTTIAIKEFSFDPSGATPPAFWVDMASGVVRSVSGKVVEQNPEAFKLSSPLGVAGIRGTTTIHEIHEDHEIHTVIELGQGHIVVITMNDGRSVVLTNSLSLVELKLDSLEPLLPQEVPRDLLREYLEQLTSMDRMRDGSHEELFALGGVDTLRWLGALPFIGKYGYLPDSFSDPLPILDTGEKEVIWKLPDPAPWGIRLHGTNGNDYLVGTDGDDWIHGYRGDDYIYAGLGRDIVYGGRGSYDTIIKPGIMTEGSELYGDEQVLSGGVTGDDDIIRVVAEAGKGPGNMTGGVIYGDAEVISDAFGGNDAISVAGAVSGGAIFGDAERITGGGHGGDDTISIGIMNGGEIFGDAREVGSIGANCGDDVIRIGTMNGGTVYGDAQFASEDVFMGRDDIFIDNYNGGTIYTGSANKQTDILYVGENRVTINSVGGAEDKHLIGTNGQMDKYIFDGNVHSDGAVVRISDFEGLYKDELNMYGFGAGQVTKGSEQGTNYLSYTCTDSMTGYSMTIILDGLTSDSSLSIFYYS